MEIVMLLIATYYINILAMLNILMFARKMRV